MATRSRNRIRGPMSARRERWVIGAFLLAGALLQFLVLAAAR